MKSNTVFRDINHYLNNSESGKNYWLEITQNIQHGALNLPAGYYSLEGKPTCYVDRLEWCISFSQNEHHFSLSLSDLLKLRETNQLHISQLPRTSVT